MLRLFRPELPWLPAKLGISRHRTIHGNRPNPPKQSQCLPVSLPLHTQPWLVPMPHPHIPPRGHVHRDRWAVDKRTPNRRWTFATEEHP